jgi:hypothetical protein
MPKWNRSYILSALAGAVIATLAGLAFLVTGVVRWNDDGQAEQAPVPTRQIVPAPEIKAPIAVPLPEPTLNRQQLLRAFSAAADAVAGNQPLPEDNASLVGKSFAVRLPFGCSGPMAEGTKDWAGWSYNPKTKALKLMARPEIWDAAPWVRQLAGQLPFDAAEGFWIRRPWTSSQACPANPSLEATGSNSGAIRNTVGIVQFFSPESPRMIRRGSRPYAITVKSDVEIAADPRDYGLLISGRIAGFLDGQPIHCINEAANLVPVCLIAVEFNRIAFEDLANGGILSEWNN